MSVERITVTKDGPYEVEGAIPLAQQIIAANEEGESLEWRQGQRHEVPDAYRLCRCGATRTPPFCDGSEERIGFDGTETASRIPYLEQAEVDAGPHVTLTDAERLCAKARFCLAQGGICLADYEAALSLARTVNDPQELLPTLGAVAAAFETRGRLDEARALGRELVDVARLHPEDAGIGLSLDFLLTRTALEHDPELREILSNGSFPRWRSLGFACLDRDFVRAAEMWSGGGSLTWEARLRLLAGEELLGAGRRTEGAEQLEKALDFYRSVGAIFYINRAEQLLAKTA